MGANRKQSIFEKINNMTNKAPSSRGKSNQETNKFDHSEMRTNTNININISEHI